ncbi:hypothetical protein ABL78_7979 [Leptomonas seymouri]|uniref:CHORD domain-containing protein n=1 Tax=Leptomonas seymouri TaxID=5684 RepID=A0A0N0P2I9_LEPSE|nr:hypothetical protein ABL78_7979 [Leptomonas seymouri]|eukprot:KPI83006.1 hypothetical protein ABL78_7979 [Leptomonas seymouri]
MKVFLIYNGRDVEGSVVNKVPDVFKLKIEVPASWMDDRCERLLLFFLKTLAAKRNVDVAAQDVCMKCGGIFLKLQDIVSKSLSDYNDVYVLHNAPVKMQENHDGELRCTNFGCNQYYKEEDNTDTSCHCHSKGPVFHDLEKHWGCCESKKAYDWESFQQIPTCVTTRHSVSNKPFSFPKEEISNIPLSAEQLNPSASASSGMHDGRRTNGPREFEGAAFTHNEPQQIVDGKAKCRNYGCTNEFVVAENNETACCYHKGGPVFWDTYKYWTCCPDKRCLEFDDFVKIPGCCVGCHKL